MDAKAPVRVRLGLVGFGSVGQALAAMVRDEGDRIKGEYGVELLIAGVATRRLGSRSEESGLDISDLLHRASRGTAHGPSAESSHFASKCPADIIVETLPLEPHSGASAARVIRAALQAGRHVVSANKGPVAHSLPELRSLARKHEVSYRFESAVADGLPVFSLIERSLPAAGITEISGLLNSTSNVVLDRLAAGSCFADAIDYARGQGITEADPSFDLDGWDAAVKLAALSAAVWGRQLPLDHVERQEITESAQGLARNARLSGRRLVSLGCVRLVDGTPTDARVRLAEMGPEDEFYPLKGTGLGLRLASRMLCPISLMSHEPTVRDTAYGMLADILSLVSAGAGSS